MKKYELRPYQKECIKVINDLPDGSRSIACLATGLGKTQVGAEIETKGRVLWLSHRDELVRQPKRYFTDPEYTDNIRTFGIEKAGETGNGEDVISASTFTLSKDKRLAKYPPDYFDIIICDEAHHAAAKTYRKVLDYFKPRKLIGLTATPKRGDGVRLTDVFDNICYTKDLKWGIENNYLSRIRCVRVTVDGFDMNKVKMSAGDLSASSLSDALLSCDNSTVVTKAYEKYCLDPQKKTLIFCPSVDVCKKVAERIKEILPSEQEGSVKILTEKIPDIERRDIIKRYKETDEVNCIINCMILTEGADLAMTEVVICDRPTVNPTLYSQIIGRGTRLYPGKEYCLVIDVVGENSGIRKICTAPTLLGLDPDKLPQNIQDRLSQGDLLTEINKILAPSIDISPEAIQIRQELMDIFTGRRIGIIKDNIGRGLGAVAKAYDDNLHADERPSGLHNVVIKTLPGDDRYYQIQATYNGNIWISKPNVLGQSYITVEIPADEAKDGKRISGRSQIMPWTEVTKITKDILENMVNSRYKVCWSVEARNNMAKSAASPDQQNYIKMLYGENYNTSRLTKLMAHDLIELDKEIKRSRQERKALDKIKPSTEPIIPNIEQQESEWKEIIKRLRTLRDGNDVFSGSVSWIPGGMLPIALDSDNIHLKGKAPTEKQKHFINSLIEQAKDKNIILDIKPEDIRTDALAMVFIIRALIAANKNIDTSNRTCRIQLSEYINRLDSIINENPGMLNETRVMMSWQLKA